MDRVAIVGLGQTTYERRKEATFEELVFEAATAALSDAGADIAAIDNIVTVSNDFWDGRTISSMAIQDAAGSWGKDISTVEGDGTFGVLYGLMRILSGSFRTTLVVAHVKGSEGVMNLITNAMFDPIYQRALGIDATSSAALQARAYMGLSGATEEDFAYVSVKNHKNALGNPYAQVAREITVGDVLASRKVADPLKLLDCSPVSDGAAAVVLASGEGLKRFKRNPVWIRGVAHCSDAYTLGYRDLARPRALRQSAQQAYAMAGIKDPARDLDLAEIYDAYSYMELMWYEGLGLAPEGGGAALIRSGRTQIEGEIPVNPSGGVLSAHPVLVAGLARIIEAVLQIRGEAGARQVKRAQTALAHGINGPCGQAHCVFILGA